MLRTHLRMLSIAMAIAPVGLLASCQHQTTAQHDINRGWLVYGNAVETKRDETPEVTPETAPSFAESGQLVVLSGTVSDVCRTMGCWLEIENTNADGSRSSLLVMNKDHAFFVPRNCRGRRVHALGYVVVETHSVEVLQHLAMDAGKSQAEIDAITEPSKRVLFIADAVILPPGGLERPVAPLPAEQEIAPLPDTSMTPAEPAATPEPAPTAEPTAEPAVAPTAPTTTEPASSEPPVDIPESRGTTERGARR
ncbi:MAG: DUF4920 domain-containing protein [bacterium]